MIELRAGERVGDWIVGDALGRGGMATVYRCRSVLSPRLQGALKALDTRSDPGSRDRFVREIETLASLRHQGIIRVLGAGEDPARGCLFMVMELIDGEDLAQKLSREAMPWRDAAKAFRDIAEGLHHAHETGVHHRDIKPANVMITKQGQGVLVDFGIALDEERTRLTEVGMVPGTVAYMPPELLLSDSRTVDASLTDVYGFGLVFYEAITRRRAFPGFQNASRQDLVRLVHEKMEHEPFDPGEIATPAIRGLIKGCTNPMPLKRPRMKGVVRLLELALAPTPGLMAAAAAEEGDEPTMVMARGFDSPPTFAVDTVKTPLPMDLRPPASRHLEGGSATPKVPRPRDPTPPRPLPQMDLGQLRRPGLPTFGQAPFDERTADLADQQVVDQVTLRAELARGRRAAVGRDTVVWLGAFAVVLFLVFATLMALAVGWWFAG